MRYRQIVILVTCCLMALGFVGLSKMRKNEFPDFTIRQGVVVAAAPGFTPSEIEQQVTKPLEDYIFTYKEVRKDRTHSVSKNGMVVVQVTLNDELKNKDEFWSKFKHGVSQFKSKLPAGVLALLVMDDFGDTSALLISMASRDKTYRELNDYMDELKDRLRPLKSVGRLTVHGMQHEQISVYLDQQRLAHYSLNPQTLAMTLFTKGFSTASGSLRDGEFTHPIYVSPSLNNVREVEELIVYADPLGNVVRLKDIARVVKEYPRQTQYITNNGTKCLLLSVEMKKGYNIVAMGEDVKKAMASYVDDLPDDVTLFNITDQSRLVDESVDNFLRELLIAVVSVIIVVMLLFPIRVALVAASTIPVSIFVSLGLFYVFGIELNTVTLAVLIVTLGMIVDNSIVIIDSYLEKIAEGQSRWHAAIQSATHFFKSIFSATLAISITFFPFLFTTKGIFNDFLQSFPWAITLVLSISLLVAELLVPFLLFAFVKKPLESQTKGGSPKDSKEKKPPFFERLQRRYDKLIEACFAHPKTVIATGVVAIVVGAAIMITLPQQLLPNADRNQFAVEIYLPVGTSVEKTAAVADSLENILRQDERVVSVASFKGCSSPRFTSSYAPVMGGENFAQFIVNTKDNKSTVAVLDEYAPRYRDAFPEAFIRFKQLGYSDAVYPIEVRVSGYDFERLNTAADSIASRLHTMPMLVQVRKDNYEQQSVVRVTLDEHISRRNGVSNAEVEAALSAAYGSGMAVTSVWEDDYSIPVVLKSVTADSSQISDVRNEPMHMIGNINTLPLRQIATVESDWQDAQITRRNGMRTITVCADLQRGVNAIAATAAVRAELKDLPLPDEVVLSYGGEQERDDENKPTIMSGLIVAIGIIFVILMAHFRRLTTATVLLCSLALCLFGATLGVVVMNVNFGVTCILGVVSLMGVLVRNCIIMIDYAEELRTEERMCIKDAIFYSAQRRMRPIFLTSAAASVGVIPMIIGGSQLWMPMGTVICFGTMITMFFILTIVPVVYWKVLERTSRKKTYRK